jgi:hypothetical protein
MVHILPLFSLVLIVVSCAAQNRYPIAYPCNTAVDEIKTVNNKFSEPGFLYSQFHEKENNDTLKSYIELRQELKPVSIDLAIDQLPKNYKGDDIVNAYTKLQNMFPPKDEFETTSQYVDRLNSSAKDVERNVYAFKYQENEYALFYRKPKYKADEECLEISLVLEWMHILRFGEKYDRDVNWDEIKGIRIKNIKEKEYFSKESNLYGVTVNVKTTIGKTFEVAVVNYECFNDRYQYKINLKNLPAQKAREAVDNIGVLLICRPKRPSKMENLIANGPDFREAKIDNPFRHKYRIYYLYVELLGIWVYNFKTGEIYDKLKI